MSRDPLPNDPTEPATDFEPDAPAKGKGPDAPAKGKGPDAPAKGKGPKVGSAVLATFNRAPGPVPATLEAQVSKVHKDGTLDLVIAKTERARGISLECVPEGPRPLTFGPFWTLPEPTSKPTK